MITTRSAPTVAAHELDSRGRWTVVAICCMSLFIVGIDTSGLNLALPSIQADLSASYSQLQWVIDAYTLVLASLLMLAGSMADRFGRRRVFRIGLTLFGLGSLLCSLAPSIGFLIGARMLQAVGGSMLNPVAMSIITNTIHDPRERAKAIGMWGGTVGLSLALGPVVGGALVDAISWQAIFWLNIPVVLTALLLTARFVPESRAASARRFDPVGQLAVIVLLASLTYAIIEGRGLGWTSAAVVGCFVLAALALAVLVAYERRRPEPLLDPRFFRSVPFSGAVVTAVLGFAAMGGFLFLNTLYLQDVRGLSPLEAGLMTLPMAGMTAVCSPLSGRVVGARGPRLPVLVAGTGMTVSALILLTLRSDTSYAVLAVAYVAFGVGFGALNAPITNTAVSGMPRAQAGVASAVASTSRQVGTSLGVAVFGAVTLGRLDGPTSTGLAASSHGAWALMLACGLGILALALITTSSWAVRSRDRVAAELA
ncbi:MFS transporter [Luteipulveratus halotolerans]|uniref:MFS transporter n=1 Tax=Luteipulveratus halotolerans TaxID=1631356 RepID=A0A0L6CLG8_9MICO|nr:MFS transporter [Luteipulveratus halotolerans]KNX38646.1 MFS transporter [Luteipulveratus halotolerans]